MLKSQAAGKPAAKVTSDVPILQLSGISKQFVGRAALRDVSLSFEAGKVHCLLGENGAGKSTLCNIIFGIHQPDTGEMRFDGASFRPSEPADSLAAGIAMVHQHFSVIGAMTVVENLMLGRTYGRLQRHRAAEKVRALSEAYELPIEPFRLVEDLSVGERQRVEVIKCLMREPRVLLLDEPTAVLPPLEIEALLDVCRKVAARGRAVLLVTHKLAEISEIADLVTVLRAGQVVDSGSPADTDISRFVHSMIGRDIASLDQTLAASLGTKSEAADDESKAVNTRTKVNALMVDGVSYHDAAGVRRLDNVTIEIRGGEIVGIAGVEGNGQSELGAILSGLATPSSGRVFVGDTETTRANPKAITAAGAGIVPEDRHATACVMPMSVAENLFMNDLRRFSRLGLVRRGAMLREAEDLMLRYDVRASGPDAPMASLSGGNQQKAVLARELSLDPLVFLLAAQPTRGLDIGAVSAVYERIRAARDNGVGVLLISSELDELLSVADRVLVIFRGRIVGELPATQSSREAIGRLMAGHPSTEIAA